MSKRNRERRQKPLREQPPCFTAPCGCKLVADAFSFHIYPCREGCPEQRSIVAAIAHASGQAGKPFEYIDAASAEQALGRDMESDELQAILDGANPERN